MSDVVHQHFRPAEQAIVKRLEEFSSGVERTGVSRRTDFLSPREAWIAQIICAKYSLAVSLYGGYEHAERQRAIISDVHEHPGEENFEVVAVRVDVPKGSSTLRHGDFLGALLGVGIRRDGLGDIAFYQITLRMCFAQSRWSIFFCVISLRLVKLQLLFALMSNHLFRSF